MNIHKRSKILSKNFFERSALEVAPCLLGKYLVRQIGKEKISLKITETEAYCGEEDLACHARVGRTARTDVMYGSAGVWYVYLVYGMHNMLNIVTEKEGRPEAVLIRSAGEMGGPGKLTKYLQIDRSLNGKTANKSAKLWIEDVGEDVRKKDIQTTERIGVEYAGEWARKPWRFVLR